MAPKSKVYMICLAVICSSLLYKVAKADNPEQHDTEVNQQESLSFDTDLQKQLDLLVRNEQLIRSGKHAAITYQKSRGKRPSPVKIRQTSRG